MKTQKQMYYNTVKKSVDCDKLFLFFVNNGMTKSELKQNIKRNPAIWSKYSSWLNKLK